MKFLTTANPRLYRAYLLKEDLRLALKAGYESIGELLRKWMSWAQRCRIPEFRELWIKIKRNMTGILATAKHMLNTGIRTEEALGLINSDIDLENRVMHVRRGGRRFTTGKA